MVAAIRSLAYGVLVVDDGSPDGTGALADRLATDDARVMVLHRPEKTGLGPAYAEAFSSLLAESGVEVICQIDADFSHDPPDLGRLVDAIDAGADLAIGSRYVPGGSTPDWPIIRQLISRGGNQYVRMMLGTPINDCTAGFRAWKAPSLALVDATTAEASGYGFQVEMTVRAVDRGLRIVEVPIAFRDRERGTSKMGGRIVAEAMWLVTRWGLTRRTAAIRSRLASSS